MKIFRVTISTERTQFKDIQICEDKPESIFNSVKKFLHRLEDDEVYTINCKEILNYKILQLMEMEEILYKRSENIRKEDEKVISLIENRYKGNEKTDTDEIIWSLEATIKEIAEVLNLTAEIKWIDTTGMEQK